MSMEEERLAVHVGLKSLTHERAQLEARLVQLLRLAENLSVWEHFGYATLVQYMEHELGYRAHTALELVRTAKALATLPQTAAALEAGRVFPSAVRELTRIVTPETEQEWLEATQGLPVHDVQRMVAGREKGSRPGDPKTVVDMVKLTYRISPTTHAFVRRACSELEAQFGTGRLEHDQLLETVFRRALETLPQTKTRPGFQMAISTCKQCKRSWQDVAGEEVDVDEATLSRARCDHDDLGDIESGAPVRVTSSVTPRNRRELHMRDGFCCAVPHCRMTRYLHVHHVTFQAAGGGHETSNTILLCTAHHVAVHKGTLRITGKAPNQLVFEWPVRERVRELEQSVPPETWRTRLARMLMTDVHVPRETGRDPP